mgnify:CR=1 FL=1
MNYEVKVTTTANLIKHLKKEKEATKDKVKMGIKRIRVIIVAWRERMKTKVDDCSLVV